MSVNPPDENAIEEAVKLKEQGLVNETVAVTIGDDKSQDVLRTSMAMGIDRSILVDLNSLEPLAVAKTLVKIIEKENPDLVLLGKQAIDDDQIKLVKFICFTKLASRMFISELKIEDNKLLISREIDEGIEKLKPVYPPF